MDKLADLGKQGTLSLNGSVEQPARRNDDVVIAGLDRGQKLPKFSAPAKDDNVPDALRDISVRDDFDKSLSMSRPNNDSIISQNRSGEKIVKASAPKGGKTWNIPLHPPKIANPAQVRLNKKIHNAGIIPFIDVDNLKEDILDGYEEENF